MSNSTLSFILHFFVIIANSVFPATKIIIPLLFLHHILKIKFAKKESQLLILTANSVLLIGGTCFLLTVISNTFFAWASGNVYERDIILSSITGPKWYQYITPVFNFALLPLFLWSKKIRSSIYFSFSIVLIWLITTNLVEYFSVEPQFILSGHKKEPDINYSQLAGNAVIYLVIFMFVFLILIKKKRRV